MNKQRSAIDRSLEILKQFRRKRDLWENEQDVLDLCKTRYKLIYSQIHEIDAPKDTEEGEKEIRELIKSLKNFDLDTCEKKINDFKRQINRFTAKSQEQEVEKAYRLMQEWLTLYENDYAIIAFRSLTHYAHFMEWEKRDKDKVWKYSIDPNNDGGYTGTNYPFFYYFNQMALRKNIKFLSKQYPTGYGKSYSNIIAISWLLGINADNDVLVVLGNPALVLTNTKGLVDMMISERYSKVFPVYRQYHEADGDLKQNMFSICRQKEGELTIAHSNKAMNVKIISKDTPVDGIRVRYLFLDDVCRSKDAGNNKQHEVDVSNYWNSWWKRNYNTDDFYVCVGGTAYSIYDILSTLKAYYSKGNVRQSIVNKYTTIAETNDCVFISVPKLDPDTDESTYPQKFPTEEARAIRDRNYRDFMAMEQQQPLPPETSPFYWDNLQTYDCIPSENRSEYCWAVIDPVRVGGDNFSMPIFVKAGEKGLHYLRDCIYRKVEQEKIYPDIIAKIRQHHITQLVIERNTDTSLKAYISDLLDKANITYCNITEVYTYEKKEIRITNQQNNIKTQLVFPAQHLYASSSEMGRFMYDIVSFSWDMNKNQNDDSIDTCTMYCEKLLNGNMGQYATVGTFRR